MRRARIPYVRFRAVPVILTLLTIALMVGAGAHIVAKSRATQLHAQVEIAEVFLTHFLEPYARASVGSGAPVARSLATLEAALAKHIDREPKIAVRIWLPDRQLLYSSAGNAPIAEHDDTDLILALQGQRVVQIEQDVGSDTGSPIAHPFLEIYFPIVDPGNSNPIAVGELYVDARAFVEDAAAFERTVWLTTGAAMLAVIGMLAFSARQSEVLRVRLDAEKVLVSQNEEMRRAAEQARFAAAEANEQTLNYIGAEIHDGPLQLLGLAALMTSPVTPPKDAAAVSEAGLVQQAMADLRRISSGLILPEIEALDTVQAFNLAVSRHRSLTGATVDLSVDLAKPMPDLDLPRRICLYRVIQEGLANATRHGGEGPVKVSLKVDGAQLCATIESRGGGDKDQARFGKHQTLGLQGMHRRLAAFNGTVKLEFHEDRATLVVLLPSNRP